MRNSLIKLFGRRFQSSTATPASIVSNSSLDLDFVLNLLDHSASKESSNTSNIKCTMPRMKFKVIELNGEGVEASAIENNTKDSFIEKNEKRSSEFSNLFSHVSEPQEESCSSLSRLQSLADSLPTQIYDRNGNLIPLNMGQPPMNFFDLDTNGNGINTNNIKFTSTLPIVQRENVDWSGVTLTSILKKIVPEEVFKGDNEEITTQETKDDSKPSTTTSTSITPEFGQVELKLLDKDQLHALAKHLNIPTDQTDFKIESAILSLNGSAKERRCTNPKNSISKEKIAWTEENENLLMKLYEELRVEKHKVDQKLQSITHTPINGTSATSLKRGNGASDRGLWAVLGDRMRQASKFHVSVTDCRNKVVILKRLKA